MGCVALSAWRCGWRIKRLPPGRVGQSTQGAALSAPMTAQKPKKITPPPINAAEGVKKSHKVDWDAVRRDYRTAKFTDFELASTHSVSREAIVRRRQREPELWPKDLGKAIKEATDDALVRQMVTQDHSKVTDTVLALAEVNKDVILSHRHGLHKLTEVKRKLLEQIEQAAENMTDLAEVIEMVRNPDDNGMDRANDALKKAMGRSALVDDLKKLADVDEKVRKGEREAFKIDDAPPPPPDAGASGMTVQLDFEAIRKKLGGAT